MSNPFQMLSNRPPGISRILGIFSTRISFPLIDLLASPQKREARIFNNGKMSGYLATISVHLVTSDKRLKGLAINRCLLQTLKRSLCCVTGHVVLPTSSHNLAVYISNFCHFVQIHWATNSVSSRLSYSLQLEMAYWSSSIRGVARNASAAMPQSSKSRK